MPISKEIEKSPTDDEFWKEIEEEFIQVEGVLEGHRVETYEEARSGELRFWDGGKSFKGSGGAFIRYRKIGPDDDSLGYFLELGRKTLPDVRRGIKRRRLTSRFAIAWGTAMMCRGFVSAYILDDSDDLSHERGGWKGAKSRSVERQKKWAAHQILRLMENAARSRAEDQFVTKLNAFIESEEFPPRFDKSWFEAILNEDDELKSTFRQKNLPEADLRTLVTLPVDDIPPISLL
jgi:hypothetical protein